MPEDHQERRHEIKDFSQKCWPYSLSVTEAKSVLPEHLPFAIHAGARKAGMMLSFSLLYRPYLEELNAYLLGEHVSVIVLC